MTAPNLLPEIREILEHFAELRETRPQSTASSPVRPPGGRTAPSTTASPPLAPPPAEPSRPADSDGAGREDPGRRMQPLPPSDLSRREEDAVRGRDRVRGGGGGFRWAALLGAALLGGAALFVYWQVHSGAPIASSNDPIPVTIAQPPPRAEPSPPAVTARPTQQSDGTGIAAGTASGPTTPTQRPARQAQQPRAEQTPVPAQSPPPAAAPPAVEDPADRVESLLNQASRFLSVNSPGRAYAAATEAIDQITRLQRQPDADAARFEDLRVRAERLSTIAIQQCDNRDDPNVNRQSCP